ncbi:MAG: hypothetical protein HYT87_12685 [Nitrospirae bacterium]|nr:hypothetical protein [Nitrospirota bacterium]
MQAVVILLVTVSPELAASPLALRLMALSPAAQIPPVIRERTYAAGRKETTMIKHAANSPSQRVKQILSDFREQRENDTFGMIVTQEDIVPLDEALARVRDPEDVIAVIEAWQAKHEPPAHVRSAAQTLLANHCEGLCAAIRARLAAGSAVFRRLKHDHMKVVGRFDTTLVALQMGIHQAAYGKVMQMLTGPTAVLRFLELVECEDAFTAENRDHLLHLMRQFAHVNWSSPARNREIVARFLRANRPTMLPEEIRAESAA